MNLETLDQQTAKPQRAAGYGKTMAIYFHNTYRGRQSGHTWRLCDDGHSNYCRASTRSNVRTFPFLLCPLESGPHE